MEKTENNRPLILFGVPLILLLIPLLSMQFTDEVNWNATDFVIAGVLLFGTAGICELVFRKVNNRDIRLGIVVALLIFLVLIWAELAVGIFDTPFAGN